VVTPITDKRAISAGNPMLATVLANFIYYGYLPSKELYKTMSLLNRHQLTDFWDGLKPALEEITGADKRMGDHIVYKNFPSEVLDMTTSEYWTRQILMYWGLPNDMVTQEEVARDSLLENTELTVLQIASSDALQSHYDQLLALPVRWTQSQRDYALGLLDDVSLDLTKIPFKENLVVAAVEAVKRGANLVTRSATDVLRLGVALSGGDHTLVEPSKFTSFSRPTRRFMMNLLENASNLEEDMARDKGKWKKFMVALRPGDYAKSYPRTVKANDSLYNDRVKSFSATVDALVKTKDDSVLGLLESRPGEFARRLQMLVQLFGRKAVKSFSNVAPSLKVMQLLKLRAHFETIASRKHRTAAPKGNWSKMQILSNSIKVKPGLFKSLIKAMDDAIAEKVSSKVSSVKLDPRVSNVTLQGNDSDLSPFGRNTKFVIPEEMKFIRTASYWKLPSPGGSTWYDNGFNFFDENWKSVGTCCWDTNPSGSLKYAVFSGDSTNSKSANGEACQMIDIYLDKAAEAGVRYAVWNILCFSHLSFDEAKEVHAALQWGEEPQKGKVFEPSRCQLSFPVRGKNHTKYVAVIDIVERTVIYVDANLKGNVSSARTNSSHLEKTMPAYMEYLNTQPTVADLFRDVPKSDQGTPILYDDDGVEINNGQAYVFKPLNESNKFEQLNVSEILGL